MKSSSEMRSTWLRPLLAISALLLLVSSGRVQDLDALVELSIKHRRAVQVERERQLLEVYERSTPQQRGSQRGIVESHLRESRSRRGPLPLVAVSHATRVIELADVESEGAGWYELIDSVDPRLVPGAFASRTEGFGEAMTVRFESLWDAAPMAEPEGGAEAVLYWVSPDGDEQVARREPVTVAAFRDGFEMYIRPPASRAGMWQLVLEVRTEQARARSLPIPVECVDGLPALRESLRRELAKDTATPLQRELSERLDELVQYGIRRASATTIAEWIACLAEREGGGALVPVPLDGLDTDATTVWELRNQASSSERVVLLLADSFESTADLITGPVGRTWESLAKETSRRVIAASPSLPTEEGGFQLEALLEHLREKQGARDIVVVARGDFGRTLPSAIRSGRGKGIDALVLCETPAARVPISSELELHTLRIESEADAAEELDAPTEAGWRRTHWRLRTVRPFASLQSAPLIADWLKSN